MIGVLPLVTEPMTRGKLRLLPTATDMMYGIVPIAYPNRVREVAEAIVSNVATYSDPVDLASIFWLPEGSPWADAIRARLVGPDWVTSSASKYTSCTANIDIGITEWLYQRDRKFRKEVQRQGRRAEEQGFRLLTITEPAEIAKWLPSLQSLYLRRRDDRGGEGYDFGEGMSTAITSALELSNPGRFAISMLEREGLVIAATLSIVAGEVMTCWIVGFDREWSALGPGIAVLVESLAAGIRAGCRIADLGVGDEPYKSDFLDEDRPLESVTWCRPRLARMLQLTGETLSGLRGPEGGMDHA
jgi:hypothetical protein